MRYEGLGQVFRCGQCQCELQPVAESVDVHHDLALGRRFRVSAIPTMTLFENGLEVARQAGAMPAPQIRKLSNKQSDSLG
jgi:thioredoxin-like negative regulator of GroEL